MVKVEEPPPRHLSNENSCAGLRPHVDTEVFASLYHVPLPHYRECVTLNNSIIEQMRAENEHGYQGEVLRERVGRGGEVCRARLLAVGRRSTSTNDLLTRVSKSVFRDFD